MNRMDFGLIRYCFKIWLSKDTCLYYHLSAKNDNIARKKVVRKYPDAIRITLAGQKNKIIEKLKKAYHNDSICMAELLAAEISEGLTFEEAHEVYVNMKQWADGDDEVLMRNKINILIERYFNLFHTDMLLRAIFDPEVSEESFKIGLEKICVSERTTDDDEFTPAEFAEV